MRRFLLVLLCLLSSFGLKANHWTPDQYQFPNSMNVVGVIEINGLEQVSDALELGAFCATECRGSEMLAFYSGLDRYMVFMTLFGESGDAFTFRLYDHNTQQELNLDCEQTIQFVVNEVVGNVVNPFVFSFTGNTCTVSVQVEPEVGGVVTGDGIFGVGDTCTLIATPNPTYSFYRWSEDGVTVSTDNPFSFVAMADRTLTAEFERIAYFIDARPFPYIAGSVEGIGFYFENDTCTLSATAFEGYTFINWTEDDEEVSTDATYTFVVDRIRYLVANFANYVGVEEKEIGFSVYPNPTNDNISVEGLTSEAVLLYDMDGNLLMAIQPKGGKLELDLGLLPAGCYFLQMGDAVKKVLKR